MVGLAVAIFVALFGFGNAIFGWSQTTLHEVQVGLFLSFLLGIVCGYKTRG
jgi:cell shape-determining protein MreD